jgi:Transcriptional regulator, AbiEi antitoxin
MLFGVVTMEEAIASGTSRRKVYRLVERGRWKRLCDGVFLTEAEPPERERTKDELWKAELAARLLSGGKGSFVSHRAAALLHGFEGLDGLDQHPIDVTVARPGRRPSGVHYSHILDPCSMMMEGLAVSSAARTIRDLAAVCSADVVERALESALRGPDRRRPDVWNEALLGELRRVVLDCPKRRGNTVLATVLGRRTDTDRPTGSFAETLLFQVLRDLGYPVVRQPTLDIVDPTGTRLDRFFPDLALPIFGIVIEIDGAEAHGNPEALQRDVTRQNKIRGLRILRFTASEVRRSPKSVARQIQRYHETLLPLGSSWTVDGVAVTFSENRFVVVDPTRQRRAS